MHGTRTDIVDAARLDRPHIWRETDAAKFNAILNDAEVFPLISVPADAGKPFDCTEIVANTANVLLMTEGGGIMFVQQGGGVYEFHTSFLASSRGRHAIEAARAARRWMFTRTDAMTLRTKVPAFNRAAALAVRRVGFKCEFVRVGTWPTQHGDVDVEHYAMHYPQWLWLEEGLQSAGERFHARLDAEYERHGRAPHAHSDDKAHDVIAGACVEMIRGGQIDKAINLYNHMAVFAGFGLIALVNRDPVIVDIGEAVLMLDGDDFKVLKCRR